MTSLNAVQPATGLAWLHPGWAASGLGTGALATATLMLSGSFPDSAWIEVLAFGLLCVALLLSVGAVILFGARLAMHRQALMQDLNDPIVAALFATIPGGLVITAAGLAQLRGRLRSPLPLEVVGVIGAIGFALSIIVAAAFVSAMSACPTSVVGSVTGVWFIPGTVMMGGVILLVSLSDQLGWSASSAEGVNVLAGAALGIGLGMTAVAGGMLAIRLLDCGRLSPEYQPSLLIVLSPLSMGSIALILLIRRLVPGSEGAAVWIVTDLAATMLWGFALFWGAICVLGLRWMLRTGIPFSPSWWAFVFPLAAFAEATLRLGQVWPSRTLTWLGAAAWAAEMLIWSVVIVKFTRETLAGRVTYR